jgi:hypothetical protein
MRINFGLACFVLQLPVSSNLVGGCLLAALAARRVAIQQPSATINNAARGPK